MTVSDHVLRGIHRLAVMYRRRFRHLRQSYSQHIVPKLSSILQNLFHIFSLLHVSPSFLCICLFFPSCLKIGLKIQQRVKNFLGKGEIKVVYLNFCILGGEQTSEETFVYCGKRTIHICIGAYGRGVSCVWTPSVT